MVVEWRFSVLGFFLFISVYPLFWSSAVAMSAWNSCKRHVYRKWNFYVDHTRTRIESLPYRQAEKKKFSDVCSPCETTRFGIKTNVLLSQTSPSTANYVMAKNGTRQKKDGISLLQWLRETESSVGSTVRLQINFPIYLFCPWPRPLLRMRHPQNIMCFAISDREFSQQNQGYFATNKKSYFLFQASFAWEPCACI